MKSTQINQNMRTKTENPNTDVITPLELLLELLELG